MSTQYAVETKVRKGLLAGLLFPILTVGAMQLFLNSPVGGAGVTAMSRGEKQRFGKAVGSWKRVLNKQATPAEVKGDLDYLVAFAQQHKANLNGSFQQAVKNSRLSAARKQALLARVNQVPNGFAGVLQRGVRRAQQDPGAKGIRAAAAVRPAVSSACIQDLTKLALAINTAIQTGNWDGVVSLLAPISLDCLL